MPSCALCGEQVDLVSKFECHRCARIHCSDHRLPENHNCGGAAPNVTPGDGKVAGVNQGGSGVLGMLVVVAGIMIVLAAVGMGGAYLVSAVDSSGVSAEPIVDAASDFAEGAGDDGLNETKAEVLIHEEVNELRAEEGLRELKYREDVANDARPHSRYLAETGTVSHHGEDMSTVETRYPDDCAAVGENIAQNHWEKRVEGPVESYEIESESELAKRVVEQWELSPGHYRNLVAEQWDTQGIGVVKSGSEIYVTQGFCGT